MSTRTTLLDLSGRLSEARVLCVGDVMLDRFVYGGVERISPEAPIPVLKVSSEESMLGGAGNVARNLSSLGAKACFVAVIGDDAPGREVSHMLDELNNVEASLIIDEGRTTAIKTRFLAGQQQMLRADAETDGPLSTDIADQLLDAVKAKLDDCTVVVLSDYGKGVLCDSVRDGVIAAAGKAGKPVIVDPKGIDYAIYSGATLVTPNRKELHDATRMAVDTDDAVIAAGRLLLETCGIEQVLATRSADGMSLITAQTATHMTAAAREVFDVSGAGDTVVATLAAALAAGAPMDDAAALANVAAGIVVAKVGTATVYVDDLMAELHHQDISGAEAKVLSLDAALDRIAAWRSQGLKVGFTNGCFDLIHPGHVSILAQSRKACDKLIVGLNSDGSIQRLKGPTRPVQAEAARATVLASFATVDMVVLFEEDTPIDLISAMRPDVLVKGKDYTVDTVVGADAVHSYGGKVLLADLEDGHSTTNIIQRSKD